MSVLGIGTASLGGMYESMDEEAAIEMVVQTVKSGLNYIDTAPFYGVRKSETLLGKVMYFNTHTR